jgi:uncharacterized protein
MSILHFLYSFRTRVLTALFLTLLIGLKTDTALAKVPIAKALLWEISGKNLQKSSYLFGTLHSGCKSRLLLSPVQQQAINKVHQFYGEIDRSDVNNAVKPKISGNKKLKDLMTALDYQLLEDYFGFYKLEKEKLNEVRPTFLALDISAEFQANINKKLCKDITSKDDVLEQAAVKRKITVNGIETTKDRVGVLDKILLQEEVKLLTDFISYTSHPGLAEKNELDLQNLYANQDINAIFAKGATPFSSIFDALVYGRNNIWVSRMSKIMAEKPTFFAFGTVHLGGEKGLISLLEAAGYNVRPVFDANSNQKSNLTAKEYFEYGDQKRLDNENLDAINNYNSAINLNSQYAEAYYERGVLKKDKLNDNQGALADLTKAIVINPKYSDAYYQRSFLRSESLDYKGAEDDLTKVIYLDPKFVTPYYERGILRGEKLNDPQKALSDLDLAITLNRQSPAAYLARGILKYNKLNDKLGGIADVRRAIKLAKIRDDSQELEKAKVVLRIMGII